MAIMIDTSYHYQEMFLLLRPSRAISPASAIMGRGKHIYVLGLGDEEWDTRDSAIHTLTSSAGVRCSAHIEYPGEDSIRADD